MGKCCQELILPRGFDDLEILIGAAGEEVDVFPLKAESAYFAAKRKLRRIYREDLFSNPGWIEFRDSMMERLIENIPDAPSSFN
ncbi:MAG: hypothetical protein HQL31_03820, partial [Planctomycetes bacterium]|nr:hypothetical protein [Planctomycetota bacterium]